MNNRKTAISLPVIDNLIDLQNSYNLLTDRKIEIGEKEECQHSFEFSPSPVELGFVERCNNCDAVKSINGSEKLDELIGWLSLQVEEFENIAKNTFDEREQAYYLDCANNKTQLINQVNRFKEKAISQEKEEEEKAKKVETICDLHDSVPPEVVPENEIVPQDDEKDRAESIDLKAEIIKLITDFFVTLGEKLKIYRDNKLYRFEADTFGAWCEQEAGIKRNHAYRLIRAFEVYDSIQSKCIPLGYKKENNSHDAQKLKMPLPTSERQLRPLTKLPQEQWYPTWVEAIEQSENKNKPPSGKLVERIVKEKQRMEKQTRYQPQVDRFKVGDVVRITAKHNPDLKEYHNCWGQVLSVEEHSYTIQTWKEAVSEIVHDDLMLLPRDSKDTAKNLLKKLRHSYQLHPKDPDLVAFLHYLGTKPIPEASELAIAFLNFVDMGRISS